MESSPCADLPIVPHLFPFKGFESPHPRVRGNVNEGNVGRGQLRVEEV